MDILQETALAIIGFAGGVSVAAGTFALITALGIIPRLASRMGVAEHVYKLESAVVLGGTIGSLLSVYHFPMRIGDVGIIIFGLFAGCSTVTLLLLKKCCARNSPRNPK